jgi:hypothetical protein
VRYDRVVALLLSTGVTLFALLAGVGVIGTGVGATPAYAERGIRSPGSESASAPDSTSLAATAPGDDQAVKATSNAALPAASGRGRRVVFDMSAQRVWLVGQDDGVRRSYLVSGSLTDNLRPGHYTVYSRSRWANGIDDSGVMQYFVRFAHGTRAAIGFHDIPELRGVPLQSKSQLGTPQSHGCIRQARPDAIALWDFAPTGTAVDVVA